MIALNRLIDFIAGVLLFSTGAMAAWGCYAWLFDPLLSFFVLHHWWFWSVGILGTIAALSGIGLCQWPRCSALIGIAAELILGCLLAQWDYTVSALAILVAALVYWRFVYAQRTANIHEEV
jgi:hypothetical protein